jgi:hypothetical protein
VQAISKELHKIKSKEEKKLRVSLQSEDEESNREGWVV